MSRLSVVLWCAVLAPSLVRAEEDCGSMVETVTRFRGGVMAVEVLGKREMVLTPADERPLFSASVRIVDVEGGDGALKAGQERNFGIHSPARVFLTDPAPGVERDFEIHAMACNGSFRRFYDLRERGPAAVEEFEGSLEVGRTYRTRIRWDRDLGLLPALRLVGPRHQGLGIDWKNLDDFPALVPGGPLGSVTFEVVERRTDDLRNGAWATIYACRILGAGGD